MEPRTILLIEDEKALSHALMEALTEKGFSVEQAFDGASGLEMARKNKYDLVLLDLLLPMMSGEDVLARLTQEQPGTKVLILTNVDDMETVANIVSRGGYEYLVKENWELKDIVQRIQEKISS